MVSADCSVVLVLHSLLGLLTAGDPTVTCVFRQSCVLPCDVSTSSDPLISWTHLTSGGGDVHSHYDGRDQLGHQDQRFRGRTSLFGDQISRGNASLKLTGVKVQDEGTYRCYTSTTTGHRELFTNLEVEAPVSAVSISQEGDRISCSSEGIYPQPELSWSTIPPSSSALETRTRVQQTKDQLYSISSSLMVSDGGSGLSYSCTVRTRSNNMTAALDKQNNKPAVSNVMKIIGRVLMSVMGLAPVCCLLAGCLKVIKLRRITAAHKTSTAAANQESSYELKSLQETDEC